MPMYECFLCDNPFEFGTRAYLGKRARAWDIMVCNGCLAVNRDGVVAEIYPHLAVHLEVRGIQPEKDAEGCILWPSN
jgi:hypothetical protein